MERDVPLSLYEKLSQKYGMSIDQAKANSKNMVQMAREVGLDFQMDTLILTNTFDAHRVVMFANKHNLMIEMIDRLLYAYYTESKHIGDHTTLIQLATEVGLNGEAVAELLASTSLSDEVRADEQEASELGINSIPFFLINRKYAITGAQSEDTFIQTFEQIIQQDGLLTTVTEDGITCDENGCEIPSPKK